MASIAVKSPHVSLCRLAMPAAKGWGRRRMQNPRPPGDMRASFTFEAQISGQTDRRPREGAKKASNEVVKFWLFGFWPSQVLARTARTCWLLTKTQSHPPFQHCQGSSTAVVYSSHFFPIFSERANFLAYAGMRELPLIPSRTWLVRCTPKPNRIPHSNTTMCRQLPSNIRAIFSDFLKKPLYLWYYIITFNLFLYIYIYSF